MRKQHPQLRTLGLNIRQRAKRLPPQAQGKPILPKPNGRLERRLDTLPIKLGSGEGPASPCPLATAQDHRVSPSHPGMGRTQGQLPSNLALFPHYPIPPRAEGRQRWGDNFLPRPTFLSPVTPSSSLPPAGKAHTSFISAPPHGADSRIIMAVC